MDPRARTRRAAKRRAAAQQEWREAIIAQHAAGFSLRVIGADAGVSHVYVLQVVRAHSDA